MKVAIIGAGNVGRTLGGAWGRRGHDVSYGVRDPEDPKYAALNGHATTNDGAVQAADVVVLCTPWQATERAVAECGDLTGKVVIDCTNPLSADFSSLVVGHTSSGAEELAERIGRGRLVCAFNTVPSEVLLDVFAARRKAARPGLVYYGDDARAKKVAAELIRDLGFDPVDAGPLRIARYAEPFALLVAQLAYEGEGGPELAYRFVRFPSSG